MVTLLNDMVNLIDNMVNWINDRVYWQRLTKAEHNRPVLKLFGNRPSASAAKVFGEIIGLVT